MSYLEIGETAVIDDNSEYVCFANIEHNDKKYAFLMTNVKPIKIVFVEQVLSGDELELHIVDDPELKKVLLNKYEEKIKKTI